MAGQIIERGEKTWLLRVYLGIDPETGKRQYHNKRFDGNKEAAQTELDETAKQAGQRKAHDRQREGRKKTGLRSFALYPHTSRPDQDSIGL